MNKRLYVQYMLSAKQIGVSLSFSGLDLSQANLSNIEFPPKTDFSGCRLGDTNFSNSSLVDANFTDCYLLRTNFDGADLSQADLTRAILFFALITNANVKDTKFGKPSVVNAKFDGTDKWQATWQKEQGEA